MMRPGYKFDFIIENDELVAISLGADYCAEHECGINGIRFVFRMNNEGLGVEKKKIGAVPQLLQWVDNKKYSGIFLPKYRDEKPQPGKFYPEKHLYTAWDANSFLVAADRKKEINYLKEIYQALQNKDACIWLGGGGVFQNAGLCIAILSKLSKVHLATWKKADEDHIQLEKDAKKTGIEKKLREAGKDWFALSPSRDKDGNVHFWLNPIQQNANNSGWFTVQELEQWIQNKGPIPKVKETRALGGIK